jgi:hypothetical protein
MIDHTAMRRVEIPRPTNVRRMNVDEVIAEACAATGLNDFGDDSFRSGFEAYCRSVASEAALNDLGQIAIRATVVGALSNRLRVMAWVREHPEVRDEKINAPLVVIGMFRAGTTFLSNLLEHDPESRALLRWEAMDSAPPPTPETFRTGPRVEAARAANDMLEMLNPKMRAIHHEEADGPTECISVMSQDFKSLSWEAITNVPTYSDWLLADDQTSAYEYHRLVLQVLQSTGVRGNWALKSPHHALALDALTSVYPDARLVLLHRDPAALCASVCSLVSTLTSTFSDADHRAYIAEHWVGILETCVARIDAFRDVHPNHPIIDVAYDDLVRAPVETVASIYSAFASQGGPGLSDEARRRMAEYVAAHPKNALGKHSYGLAEFGLDEREIRQRFAGYIERYNVSIGCES